MNNKRQERKISVIIGIIMVCLSFLVCGVIVNKERVQSQSAYAIEEGGSVYIKSGATYTMGGGSISNKLARFGGFIYVADGGTFIMNGGTLSGGSAEFGGAIYVASGGKAYLNTGTIQNCNASGGGNAVYVEDGGYLEMGEGFVITSSGTDYTESIRAVDATNVKRPVLVTPYVNGVEKTAIKTFSNVNLGAIGLPSQTGCGWYQESTYKNKVSTNTLVGTYAETNELKIYFPSHNYGNWVTTTVATCTATGLQNKTCTICSDVQSQTLQIDASNHGTWGTYTGTITAATCLKTGTKGTYCSGCKVLKSTSEIAIDGSNHEKTTTHTSTITFATCIAKGTMGHYYDCCNALKNTTDIAIDANNHTKTTTHTGTITAATCIATGTMGHYYDCCNALKNITDIAIDANNHTKTTTYNSTITASTCTATGTMGTYYDCCKALKSTSTIAKQAHGYAGTYTGTITVATCVAKGTMGTYCTKCDQLMSTADIAINANNHTKTTTHTSTITLATCIAKGTMGHYYDCCNALKNTTEIAIDANNHTKTTTHTGTITAATCIATGTMGHYYDCCNALKNTTEIAIDANNHTKTTTHTETITAATCTTNGTTGHYYDCCNALKTTSSINALGHSYGNWATTTTATCYRAEVQTRVCSRDSSHTETQTLSRANHNYNDYISTTNPTCVDQGYDKYECQWCTNYIYKNYTAATGHNWQTTSYNTGVNCVTQGSTNQTCSRCSSTQTIAGGGYYGPHSYTSSVTKAATCKAEGVRSYSCANSSSHDYTESIAVNSSNHEESATTSYGNGYTSCTTTGFIKNYYPCCDALISNTSYSSHAQGTYFTNDATCTYKGYDKYYCSRKGNGCTGQVSVARSSYDTGYHYQSLGGAAWDTYTSVITAATCTATGSSGTYCSGCGARISTSTIPIDSTNHSWGSWSTTTTATCQRAEVQTRVCSRSSSHTETQTLSKARHNYNDYVSTTAATCSSQGYDKYECQWCTDYVYKNYTAINSSNHSDISRSEGLLSSCVITGYIQEYCYGCNKTVSTSSYSEHSFGDYYVTKEATCVEKGTKRADCTRSACTSYRTSQLAVNSGNHVNTTTQSGLTTDCTTTGYLKNVCTDCDTILSSYSYSSHSYGYWKTTTAATCTTTGTKRYYCNRTGCSSYNSTQTIAALGHNYTISVSAAKHKCSRCSTTAVHMLVIDELGRSVCSLCGYTTAINFAPTGNCVCKEFECDNTIYYPETTIFIKKETAFLNDEDGVIKIE